MFIRLKGHQMCIWEVFQTAQSILQFLLFPSAPYSFTSLLSGLAGTLLVCVVLHLLWINKQVIISNSGDTGSSCKMVETIQWPLLLWTFSLVGTSRIAQFLFPTVQQFFSGSKYSGETVTGFSRRFPGACCHLLARWKQGSFCRIPVEPAV